MLSTDRENSKESIIQHYSNKLMQWKNNNKYYFNSKKEIKVKVKILNLSNIQENFCNEMFDLYYVPIKQAGRISKEPIDSFVKNLSPKKPIVCMHKKLYQVSYQWCLQHSTFVVEKSNDFHINFLHKKNNIDWSNNYNHNLNNNPGK